MTQRFARRGALFFLVTAVLYGLRIRPERAQEDFFSPCSRRERGLAGPSGRQALLFIPVDEKCSASTNADLGADVGANFDVVLMFVWCGYLFEEWSSPAWMGSQSSSESSQPLSELNNRAQRAEAGRGPQKRARPRDRPLLG